MLRTPKAKGIANVLNIAIAGAGLSGAVLARECAMAGHRVTVFESRDHLAGNCHTTRDAETGVMAHVYGPHIFHTSNEMVWNYVQQFATFLPFTNRVKSITQGKAFSLPINLLTINQFFGKTFNPTEAQQFVSSLADRSIAEPANFEEQALRFVGKELYEAFFKSYTLKQWGIDPRELPASILQRLPVRFNYDDNYYNSRFQGMPKEGYTALVENILAVPGITVHLERSLTRREAVEFDHVFVTGPIDAWFDHCEGRLRYRTLDFLPERHDGDYQGNAVINYPSLDVPYTRITEHKHFAPWESHGRTLIFKELSRDCGPEDTPYYPLRLVHDKALLERYVALAEREANVSFAGRLGTYRYLDMHVTIAEALALGRQSLQAWETNANPPVFSVRPL